jgi:pyruvate/2-oxoglutarate/acetoin dehydrogenase E1 component
MTKISTYSENIFNSLNYVLSKDKNFSIIGQGLWSPWYVGNTMKDLEKKFGKIRILDTPVSEAATTGLGLGLSLHSKVMIIHPRMDFSLLAFDQLINQLSNWELIFGGQSIPDITIRLIINRGGEQGAQHSQALHSILAHFPRLKVVMPYSSEDAGLLLISSINYRGPVIYIDDRWLYEKKSKNEINFNKIPNLKKIKPKLLCTGHSATIVSFGFGTEIARKVTKNLNQKGFNIDLLDLRIINPIDFSMILKSVKKTKKLIVIDIGYASSSIGSTIIANISNKLDLKIQTELFCLLDTPAPTSSNLENIFYHSIRNISKKILKNFF